VKILLNDALTILKYENPLLNLSTPVGGNLSVLGDVHGQFTDVLHIFDLNGWPSADNIYVFNGDLVDRGPQSFEIVLTLLSLKLLTKGLGLKILRGNHETARMNSQYGFERELRRYGFEEGRSLFELTNEVDNKFIYYRGRFQSALLFYINS
jgi:serine/threonine-protein phosphatase 5